MAKVQIEVWVMIDSSGDYGVGKDEDSALGQYEGDIGGGPEYMVGSRMVKVVLNVEMPEAITLTADIPCEQGKAMITSIKA